MPTSIPPSSINDIHLHLDQHIIVQFTLLLLLSIILMLLHMRGQELEHSEPKALGAT